MKHPRLWVLLSWLASLAAVASALVLADFGAPTWIFVLLFSWLLTVGLPTLLFERDNSLKLALGLPCEVFERGARILGGT